MSSGSIASNGVGVRELCWCVGGVPQVAKNREKAKRKLRPPFFHSIDIVAIFRKRYGTSLCALYAVIAVPPFGTRPVGMRIHARRRRDCDCTANICVLGGAFAESKRGDFIFAIFSGIFLPFSPHPHDFERVWTFRRPRERGPSLHNLPPPLFLFSPFSSRFLPRPPPSGTGAKKMPFFSLFLAHRHESQLDC